MGMNWFIMLCTKCAMWYHRCHVGPFPWLVCPLIVHHMPLGSSFSSSTPACPSALPCLLQQPAVWWGGRTGIPPMQPWNSRMPEVVGKGRPSSSPDWSTARKGDPRQCTMHIEWAGQLGEGNRSMYEAQRIKLCSSLIGIIPIWGRIAWLSFYCITCYFQEVMVPKTASCVS